MKMMLKMKKKKTNVVHNVHVVQFTALHIFYKSHLELVEDGRREDEAD